MATSLPRPQECHNCMRKHRSCPPDKEYKRCSGCHLTTYCDPQCQEEHWIKVHNKHCKVIDGRKHRSHTIHGEDCATCLSYKTGMKSDDVIDEQGFVGRPFEANLPCMAEETVLRVTKEYLKQFGVDENMSMKLKAPFRFGELGGQYLPSKYDEHFAHMWNILQVIHNVYYDQLFAGGKAKPLVALEDHILFLRGKVWRFYTIFGNCSIIEAEINDGGIDGGLMNAKAVDLMKAVNEVIAHSIGSDNDKTKMVGRMTSNIWWSLFLNHFEGLANFEAKHHALTEFTPSCFEGNAYPTLKRVHAKYQSHPNFKTFWPVMAGSHKMFGLPMELRVPVPPNASCCVCKERISAQCGVLYTVFPSMLDMFRGAGCPESFVKALQAKHGFALVTQRLQGDGGRSVFCSASQNPRCVEYFPTFLEKDLVWNKDGVYQEYVTLRSVAKFCDNCLRGSVTCHRCSICKSSQYCSKECLQEDWEKYHKSVCEKLKMKKDKKLPCSKKQKDNLHNTEEAMKERRGQQGKEMKHACKSGMTCNNRVTKK